MIFTFAIVYLLLACLAIVSRQLAWKIAPVCKALPVSSLVIFLTAKIFTSSVNFEYTYVLFIVGLALGLAGDIMFLDKKRFFKPGVVAFFSGHIVYILAFACLGLKFSIIPLLPAIFYFASYTLVMFGSLLEKHKKYLGIGIMYLVSLASMVIFSHFTDTHFESVGLYTFFYVGAFLFSMSDGVLTYRIFGKHFRFSDIIVLSSYFLAQGIIALNAMIIAGIVTV